jgi:hypothetical protein
MVEKFTIEQIKQTLINSNGFVSIASKKLNCDPKTVYNYINNYTEIKEALEDIRNANLDFCENMLMNHIKEGDKPLLKFYLQTQGKHRGYIERVENHNLEVTTFDDLPKLNDLNVK